MLDVLRDRVTHDPDPQVFRIAAESLGPLADAGEMRTALLARAADPDPAIRRQACQVLGDGFG
ncbi:HEAT repeat domain-containing protein, partial [Dactylosporangium sp. NPDC049140]|uniref:HEAT repeat domain-containing protein n=1 Tax=Dactylosporangium sp. NPDC049140 TaxID=3155647 RepID=UPI0033F01266